MPCKSPYFTNLALYLNPRLPTLSGDEPENGDVEVSYTSAIDISPDGKYVFTTNEGSRSVSVFKVVTDGALQAIPESPFAADTTPTALRVHPSGKFLYASNTGNSNISIYTINALTGAITEITNSRIDASDSPRGISIDKTGNFLYVANYMSNDVSAYRINTETGELTELSGSPYTCGQGPWGTTIDPTNKYLYVTNETTTPGAANVLAYSIDQTTGALTKVSSSPYTAGTRPRSIVVVKGEGQSDECDLVSVTNATISGQSVLATVANATTSFVIDAEVSTDASWELFNDAACTAGNELATTTISSLTVGNNTFCIKVTAADGVTSKNYAFSIYRLPVKPSLSSISYTPSLANGFTPGGTNTFDVKAKLSTQTPATVKLIIYNSKNKTVAILTKLNQSSGTKTFKWDGKYTAGNSAKGTVGKYVSTTAAGSTYYAKLSVENTGGSASSTKNKVKFYSSPKIFDFAISNTQFTPGQQKTKITLR